MVTPIHDVACDVSGLGFPRQRESVLCAFNSFFFNFCCTLQIEPCFRYNELYIFKKVFKEENQLEHHCLWQLRALSLQWLQKLVGGVMFPWVFSCLTSQQIFTSALWMPLVLIFWDPTRLQSRKQGSANYCQQDKPSLQSLLYDPWAKKGLRFLKSCKKKNKNPKNKEYRI